MTALFSALLFTAHPLGAKASTALDGKWIVDSIGSECVTTGWLEDNYKPKFGELKGTEVRFSKDQMQWGKSICKSLKLNAEKEEFTFFDGSACSEASGELPEGCAKLMKAKKGKEFKTITATCKDDSEIGLPKSFTVLSDKYLLADEGGYFICLKRAK